MQLSVHLAHHQILQVQLLVAVGHRGMEVADVDAHDAVASRTLPQVAVYGVLAYMVYLNLQVGQEVDMFGIEEAALGLAVILAGMVVVVAEPQIGYLDGVQAVLLLLIYQGAYNNGVVDMPALLVGFLPLRLQVLNLDMGLIIA